MTPKPQCEPGRRCEEEDDRERAGIKAAHRAALREARRLRLFLRARGEPEPPVDGADAVGAGGGWPAERTGAPAGFVEVVGPDGAVGYIAAPSPPPPPSQPPPQLQLQEKRLQVGGVRRERGVRTASAGGRKAGASGSPLIATPTASSEVGSGDGRTGCFDDDEVRRWEAAVSSDPSDATALEQLASVLVLRGDGCAAAGRVRWASRCHGRAEDALRAALALSPSRPAAAVSALAALLCGRLCRPDDAVACIEAAAEAAAAAGFPLAAAEALAAGADTLRKSSLAPRAVQTLLERAAALAPEDATVALALADCVAEADGPVAAVGTFARAEALDPSSARAAAGLGSALLLAGKPTEAAAALARAVALDPGCAAALTGLADLAAASSGAPGARDRAAALYSAAVAADPGCAGALCGLSAVMEERGDAAGAGALLARALSGAPTSARALAARAGWLARRAAAQGPCAQDIVAGQDSAETLFRRALAFDPDCESALLGLADLLQAGGAGACEDSEEAEEEAEKLLEHATAARPASAEALWRRAAQLAEAGNAAGAAQLLARASLAAPAHQDVRFELAGLEERSGRAGWAAEAELLYRRALVGSPAHVPCLAGLADLLSAGDGDGDGNGDAFEGTGNKSADFGGRGRLAEAVSLYIRALRASPSDAAIARNLGRAYEMAGDAIAAMAYYRRAVSADPADAPALCGLGLLLWEVGHEATEARRVLEAAVRHAPQDVRAHFAYGTLLAEAFAAVGEAQALPSGSCCSGGISAAVADAKLALEHLRHAADLDPADPAAHAAYGGAVLKLNGDAAAASRAFACALDLDPVRSTSPLNPLCASHIALHLQHVPMEGCMFSMDIYICYYCSHSVVRCFPTRYFVRYFPIVQLSKIEHISPSVLHIKTICRWFCFCKLHLWVKYGT